MSQNPTRLTISYGDAPRQLVLAGDLDSHTAPDLDGALEALGTDGPIVVDLAGVQFIDSSGLRVIITTHTTLDELGHKLTLVGSGPAALRLFEVTGLADHLHLA